MHRCLCSRSCQYWREGLVGSHGGVSGILGEEREVLRWRRWRLATNDGLRGL